MDLIMRILGSESQRCSVLFLIGQIRISIQRSKRIRSTRPKLQIHIGKIITVTVGILLPVLYGVERVFCLPFRVDIQIFSRNYIGIKLGSVFVVPALECIAWPFTSRYIAIPRLIVFLLQDKARRDIRGTGTFPVIFSGTFRVNDVFAIHKVIFALALIVDRVLPVILVESNPVSSRNYGIKMLNTICTCIKIKRFGDNIIFIMGILYFAPSEECLGGRVFT